MASIINLKHYTEAIRNSGYKNSESAISEIIDNSIEANAKEILIILDEKVDRKGVTEIGILDNGFGMNNEILERCLSIGDSTRRDRKGMGRFGVGLPQASLYITPRVEVYSWQDGFQNCKYVYLDTEEISNGIQNEIRKPEAKKPDKKYELIIENKLNSTLLGKVNFNKNGTLVVWKNCDKLYPKKVISLTGKLETAIGRKFRYFLNDNVKICISKINSTDNDLLIMPNDPLYLMDYNQIKGSGNGKEITDLKGHSGEPLFELYSNGKILGEIDIPITHKNNKTSEVKIRFSIAKEKFHDEGGGSKIGKHVSKNVGVSIVRAKREIDFGKFDFFSDTNEPQHRWWGCEVLFEPELDEVFGVANNKQQVLLQHSDEEEENNLWSELNKIIYFEIKTIYKKLKERKVDYRRDKNSNRKATPEEKIVQVAEKGNKAPTASEKQKSKLTEKQIEKGIIERLEENGIPDPDKTVIEKVLKNKVNIEYRDLGDNSYFIDISTKLGVCFLTINTASLFYQKFYSLLDKDKDSEVLKALNLILMAYARAEDEKSINEDKRDAFIEVREAWGHKIRDYLKLDKGD